MPSSLIENEYYLYSVDAKLTMYLFWTKRVFSDDLVKINWMNRQNGLGSP